MRRKRYLSRTRSNDDVVSTIKKFFVKIINFGIEREKNLRCSSRKKKHDIHAAMLPLFESKIDFYHLERALPYRDSSKNFLNVNKEIKSMSISRIYDSFWL